MAMVMPGWLLALPMVRETGTALPGVTSIGTCALTCNKPAKPGALPANTMSAGDWRKLHIGVDAKGFIVAAELTARSRDDASTLPDLLAPLEVLIRRFTADGVYDHRSVYDRASAAGTENVVIVIPPRRSALSSGPTDGPWAQREASLQRIRKVGRREWQKESGYRQQARVENSFFRYKSVFGGGLKARHSKAQRTGPLRWPRPTGSPDRPG